MAFFHKRLSFFIKVTLLLLTLGKELKGGILYVFG